MSKPVKGQIRDVVIIIAEARVDEHKDIDDVTFARMIRHEYDMECDPEEFIRLIEALRTKNNNRCLYRP